MAAQTQTPVLAVFISYGGLADCGKHLISHALKAGLRVKSIAIDDKCLYQSESMTPITVSDKDKAMLEHFTLDITDSGNVPRMSQILEDVDAVAACAWSRQPSLPRIAETSMSNILKAMEPRKDKYNRLVVMSSTGMREDWPPMRYHWGGTVFACMMRTVLRKSKKELESVERMTEASAYDYLLVRPVGLDPGGVPKGPNSWTLVPPRNQRVMSPNIAKEDVASFMLGEIMSPTLHRRAQTITTSEENVSK